MRIDTELAAYLTKVTKALDDGNLLAFPHDTVGSKCPECGDDVWLADSEHVYWTDDHPHQDPRVVVIVGCEGYWIVNPALVGIDKPSWQPVTDF